MQQPMKNYSHFWGILKDRNLIKLEFKDEGAGRANLEYQVSLWRSGISKSKTRDSKFNRMFPNARVCYDVTFQQKGVWQTALLTCTLIADFKTASLTYATDIPTLLTEEEVAEITKITIEDL